VTRTMHVLVHFGELWQGFMDSYCVKLYAAPSGDP